MSMRVRAIYEFGPFRLDATERVLARGGETVRLTPKEFETLLALVRKGGHLMTKGELLKEIWPDTFVGEATLAQNIFTLRKALGRGAPGRGAFIETVPRRGYRFAAGVRELREETPAAGGDAGAGAAGGNGNGRVAAEAEAGTARPERRVARQAQRPRRRQVGFSEARAVPGERARTAEERRIRGAAASRDGGARASRPRSRADLAGGALVFAGVVLLVFRFVVRRPTAPPPSRGGRPSSR